MDLADDGGVGGVAAQPDSAEEEDGSAKRQKVNIGMKNRKWRVVAAPIRAIKRNGIAESLIVTAKSAKTKMCGVNFEERSQRPVENHQHHHGQVGEREDNIGMSTVNWDSGTSMRNSSKWWGRRMRN